LEITPVEPEVFLGEDVTLLVKVRNDQGALLEGTLGLSIKLQFYNGDSRRLADIPDRAVSLAPGESEEQVYVISRSDYGIQGTFVAEAFLADASATAQFEVVDGFDVSAELQGVPGSPEVFDVKVFVRNLLSRQVEDLHLEVFFPSSAVVTQNPETFDFPVIGAGESAEKGWRVGFSERGGTGISAFVVSEDAGYDRAMASVDVRGPGRFLSTFANVPPVALGEHASVTATVSNIGGEVTDAVLQFVLPGSFASDVQLQQSIMGLAPGDSRSILFAVAPSEAGSFAVLLFVQDSRGGSDLGICPVVVFDQPRGLRASVEPSTIPGDDTSRVALNVVNEAGVDDDVVIRSYPSYTGMQYAIFDGTTRVLGQAVPVAGNSTKSLEIEVLPGSAGKLMVTCTSVHNPLASDSAVLVIGSNRPPSADAGLDQTIECAPDSGVDVTLDGSKSSDPDGDRLTYTWTGSFGAATGVEPAVHLMEGLHIITLAVEDGQGGSATDDVVVEVSTTMQGDVTSQVKVTRTGFRYNRATQRYVQTVTVQNLSNCRLAGPVSLALDNLSSGAVLSNRTGTTSAMPPAGSPYINLAVGADNVLAPDELTTKVLELVNPSNQGIRYDARVLAGPTPR
jgi:hypothetical protein